MPLTFVFGNWTCRLNPKPQNSADALAIPPMLISWWIQFSSRFFVVLVFCFSFLLKLRLLLVLLLLFWYAILIIHMLHHPNIFVYFKYKYLLASLFSICWCCRLLLPPENRLHACLVPFYLLFNESQQQQQQTAAVTAMNERRRSRK